LAIETSAGVSYGKNGNPPQSPITKNRVSPSLLLSFTDKSYRPINEKSMKKNFQLNIFTEIGRKCIG
jgi:hypothetical protein